MLILASASNSRRRLLEQVGIAHKVIVSKIDELDHGCLEIKQIVRNLASRKAKYVASEISSKFLRDKNFIGIKAIIGCDSLFEFRGNIFGKPQNDKEAIQRLKMMSLASGVIHTGHCLLIRNCNDFKNNITGFDLEISDVVSTKISFIELNDKDISSYVNTGEPLKCAGGFAIEGKGGMFIKSIEGCYSNVIGLSLPWLKKVLSENNISYN